MTQNIRCGDSAALIGLLYDDCDADERAAIRAHLAICAACADEFEALTATREQLVAWTPPETQLGFQVTGGQPSFAPRGTWWQRPLPAWAQLAAAVVIFGLGLGIGLSRHAQTAPPAVAQERRVPAIELKTADIEQRLSALEMVATSPVTRAVEAPSAEAIMMRVRGELDDRDLRWNRDLFEMSQRFMEEATTQKVVAEKRVRDEVNAQLNGWAPVLPFNAARGNGD